MLSFRRKAAVREDCDDSNAGRIVPASAVLPASATRSKATPPIANAKTEAVPRINFFIFTRVSTHWRIAKLFPQTLESATRSLASLPLAKSVVTTRLDQLSRRIRVIVKELPCSILSGHFTWSQATAGYAYSRRHTSARKIGGVGWDPLIRSPPSVGGGVPFLVLTVASRKGRQPPFVWHSLSRRLPPIGLDAPLHIDLTDPCRCLEQRSVWPRPARRRLS